MPAFGFHSEQQELKPLVSFLLHQVACEGTRPTPRFFPKADCSKVCAFIQYNTASLYCLISISLIMNETAHPPTHTRLALALIFTQQMLKGHQWGKGSPPNPTPMDSPHASSSPSHPTARIGIQKALLAHPGLQPRAQGFRLHESMSQH